MPQISVDVYFLESQYCWVQIPVASFTKEVNWRLAKRPLKTNGRLANHQLTSLVKEATGVPLSTWFNCN